MQMSTLHGPSEVSSASVMNGKGLLTSHFTNVATAYQGFPEPWAELFLLSS